MSAESAFSTLAVSIRESTVAQLLQLRQEGETLGSVIDRLAKNPPISKEAEVPFEEEQEEVSGDRTGAGLPIRTTSSKYELKFLGESLRANTLGALFGKLVDALAFVAPDAVEKFAKKRSRKRAFVARRREDIHPGRPDLRTLKTHTGWWVSCNIGKDDLKRALREICAVSGLSLRKDVRFID